MSNCDTCSPVYYSAPCLLCGNGLYGLNGVRTANINKRINNQVSVPSSLYSMNLSTVTINNCKTTNMEHKVQKHDSYARYLAQKKGKHMNQAHNLKNAYETSNC